MVLFYFLEDEKKGSPMCTVLVYIREFWKGARGIFIAQKNVKEGDNDQVKRLEKATSLLCQN